MNRDTTFWMMVIGLIIVPSLALGLRRGKAVGKAYRAICEDMNKGSLKPSQTDLQLLIGQLNRDPQGVLDAENRPEVRAIKEPHVKSLIAELKSVRRYYYVLFAVGALVVFGFQYFWPKK